MSNPVGVFSPLVAWCKLRPICTDNTVFKLHYRVSVIILLAFFLTIITTQFVGEPVRCLGTNDKNKDVHNSYCWIHGTHTTTKHFKGTVGKHMPHPGVGPHPSKDSQIHHRYYQWIYFLLPLQALLFYAPHMIWKMFEGQQVKGLTEKMNGPLMPKDWTMEMRQKLAQYLININTYTTNMYAYQFAFCEFLNFANTVGQIYLLDLFLGGNFKEYGIMFVKYQTNQWDPNMISPMDIIFPKISMCTFYTVGGAGSLQNLELLCVLPLNIVHEKIFLFIWFWLIVLAVISGLALVYRLFVFMCPCIRAYSIIVQAKVVPKYYIYSIVSNFSVSDWFLLNQIGKNMNVFAFKDLVTYLGEELEKKKKVQYV